MRTPLVVMLLLACLSLTACSAIWPKVDRPIKPLSPSDTVFRVYNLSTMYPGELDETKTRTFTSMIRDAVGPDEWIRTNSSLLMLDSVLLIRTTPGGHDSLGTFFTQFRAINEQGHGQHPGPSLAHSVR